jgi:hypothetical protein
MGPDVFTKIRRACKRVAEKSEWVRIRTRQIPGYAAGLPLGRISAPELDADHHYVGYGEGTVAFILTLDTVNFGSGFFPHLRKRPGMSGYFTIASSLTDHFLKNGPLSAQDLKKISVETCTHIFGQKPANQIIRELMQFFAAALNDLGRLVLDRFGGSFIQLVEAADQKAERLVELLSAMASFNDVGSYGGFAVPFFKRAQLTAADLHLAFSGEGPGRFNDLTGLTLFADNLVPHVLRMDGILDYQEDLIARIDAEQLVPAGSAQEVEIRACALHAVELIAEEVRATGHSVTSMELDYLLWNQGQQPYYKMTKPRHRTRSTFY